MSFDDEDIDRDPHGECRAEIARLTAEHRAEIDAERAEADRAVADLRGEIDRLAAELADTLTAMEVAMTSAERRGAKVDALKAELEARQPATVGGMLAMSEADADALLCDWYRAKQSAIQAWVNLENVRCPDPNEPWDSGIGRRDPVPGATACAEQTKARLVDVTAKVIAAMTRGPLPKGG